MAEKHQFPSEVIDLPSKGLVYPEGSPLREGKVEIKYMTAREEDILTSANLIKKGVVIDRLLDSLILTNGINQDDLVLGDKNAVMIAARILAYGPEYTVQVSNPNNSSETIEHTFNLAECDFKEMPDDIDYSTGEIEVTLPISNNKVKFKLLNGKDEKAIIRDIESAEKRGLSADITTRLRYSIVSVNGDTDKSTVNRFSSEILSRDSLFLRNEMARYMPDVDMTQEVEIGGDTVEVDIPMTVEFFWPSNI